MRQHAIHVIQDLHDWIHSSDSKYVRNVLKIIGAYGIVVVFAQDIGVKTGCRQAKLVHNPYVQTLLFIAVAYSVTDDFYQSFSGALIYFIMKFIISNKTVNDVCFPTEREIREC